MKLYFHPVSTVSRPVLMLAADENIPLDFQVVDLFTGEHMQTPYSVVNPSKQVPALEDGDFCMTESSAILKYLADKVNSPAYPKDLQKRARVNERMDWLNTGFYRDFGYGLVYPQLFPHHKRPSDEVHGGTIEWGRDKANQWLKILDESILGPDNAYICGSELTIADYLAVAILTVGEVIHLDYAKYPNIARYVARMKARPNWEKVNAPFYQYFVAPFKDKTFVGL
jgi:glutathione S-transferase